MYVIQDGVVLVCRRDSQRSRVYEAEHAAFAELPRNPRAATAREVLRFLDAIGVPGVRLALKRRGKVSTARKLGREIALAPCHQDVRWVWVHEAAHLTAPPGERHGRRFCAEYLRLAEVAFGRIWRDRLAREFDLRGVKWRAAPRLTEERRSQLREQGRRLAAMQRGEAT